MFPPSDSPSSSEWPSLPFNIEVPIIEVNGAQVILFDETLDVDLDVGVSWIEDQLDAKLHKVSIFNGEFGTVDTLCTVQGDGEEIDIQVKLNHPSMNLRMDGQLNQIMNIIKTLRSVLRYSQGLVK